MNYDSLVSRAGVALQSSAIRQMGTVAAQRPDVISFAPGYPSPSTFAWQDYREIAADVLSSADPGALQYGPTRGFGPLLDAILGIVGQRGIRATREDLLVTTGSQQGLDIVARVFLDPGDVVLVELPSYTGAIAAFRNAQARLAGVRQEADGIDLEHLDVVLARERADGRRVKFLYLVPNFQNPTGLLISLGKRQRLLEWAARNDVLIVEDDPYCDLYFEDSTRPADTRPIKADDERGLVVYLSSFSKTLAPAFRTSWMVAPASLASRFETAKQSIDLCTSGLDQRIAYEACRRGVLDRQVPRLRQYYSRSCQVMEEALHQQFADRLRWARPRGGFFLWASLPEGADTAVLLRRALDLGVIYVAGGAFFVDGTGSHTMRLSFSYVTEAEIVEGVARLAAAAADEPALTTPAGTSRAGA
jgi:2-aminoadipate transaminase